MGKRLVLIWVVLAGLAMVSQAESVQWLRYRFDKEIYQHVKVHGVVRGSYQAEAPDGLALPEFKSDTVWFVKWKTPMAKAGYVWFALDRSRKNGPVDLAYSDSDGDGELSDETPVKAYYASKDRGREYCQFSSLKVLLPGEDGPVAYHVGIRFYRRLKSNKPDVHIQSSCWYEGRIVVDGKTYTCKLLDANANGTFDDRSDDYLRADAIQIEGDDLPSVRRVGKYIQIGNKYYHPKPSRDGANIEFSPVEKIETVAVRVPEDISVLSIGGGNGLLHFKPVDGLIQVPVGKYRFHEWVVEQKDETGAQWQLTGEMFPPNRVVNVEQGKEQALDIGQPVIANLSVRRQGKDYVFNQSLRGRMGESVSLSRNGKRPKAPRLKIVNADQTYARNLAFEYG